MMDFGYVVQIQTKKDDCKHCVGKGKCDCNSCRKSFSDENKIDFNQLPKGEVKCIVCEGTGNDHYLVRQALFVNSNDALKLLINE